MHKLSTELVISGDTITLSMLNLLLLLFFGGFFHWFSQLGDSRNYELHTLLKWTHEHRLHRKKTVTSWWWSNDIKWLTHTCGRERNKKDLLMRVLFVSDVFHNINSKIQFRSKENNKKEVESSFSEHFDDFDLAGIELHHRHTRSEKVTNIDRADNDWSTWFLKSGLYQGFSVPFAVFLFNLSWKTCRARRSLPCVMQTDKPALHQCRPSVNHPLCTVQQIYLHYKLYVWKRTDNKKRFSIKFYFIRIKRGALKNKQMINKEWNVDINWRARSPHSPRMNEMDGQSCCWKSTRKSRCAQCSCIIFCDMLSLSPSKWLLDVLLCCTCCNDITTVLLRDRNVFISNKRKKWKLIVAVKYIRREAFIKHHTSNPRFLRYFLFVGSFVCLLGCNTFARSNMREKKLNALQNIFICHCCCHSQYSLFIFLLSG